jgi:cytochrome P450
MAHLGPFYDPWQCLICCSVAGSDTTSVATTLALVLLVNNPEKMKNLVAELDKTFPSSSDEVTFAKTQDLQYLNAVIYETMRLEFHPPSKCLYLCLVG